MRLANIGGRAVIDVGGGIIDVQRSSGGRYGPGIHELYEQWRPFCEWASAMPLSHVESKNPEAAFGAPSPTPRQVFGIGMNYRAHAAETGHLSSEIPTTFTKFPSCIAGDHADVDLPSDHVDWEVELVIVIGRHARNVAEADGWAHVAGLTIGQDLSERIVQFAAGNQFSLGKSYPDFGPIGPVLVTPDEFAQPDDLAIECTVNGELVQKSRTSDMMLGVPRLVAELSAVVTLLPGDVIFTGTPAGVGFTRQPPRYLSPGDVIRSTVEGIGTLTTRIRA